MAVWVSFLQCSGASHAPSRGTWCTASNPLTNSAAAGCSNKSEARRLGFLMWPRIGWDPGTCVGQSLRISNRFLLRPDVEGAKRGLPQGFGGNSVVKIAEQKMMPFCNLCQTPQFLGTIFQVSWCPFLCRFCLGKAGRWKHGFHSWELHPSMGVVLAFWTDNIMTFPWWRLSDPL